ncbi:CBASS cGAMP-activated phospholipase [Thiocapsa roseopersicina]|uniref:Patatin-like phospholipase n=1 Tax=Thiocapsa roseopersicina TaxID=1058 RepID=A0A1H2YA80_THIRO|nr:CBASS cGAMP-activated phospholipase [Thiocapsa roseopersicina]SDX01950.1 Patatin-like phospholipase [Thiocapsa roseopersicina]
MDQFSILSLDGGGIRGVFVAGLLARIEERNGIRIAEHFDLIAGTSTGGIVALGLGLGFSAREIVEFYRDNAEVIFPSVLPKWARRLPGAGFLEPRNNWALFRRKFSSEPLERALRQVLGADRVLGDSTTRLVITAMDARQHGVKLFKTAHAPGLNSDWKIPAWLVAAATSAAPTYFPAAKVDNRLFYDGGLWANNPVMVGVTEALGVLDIKPSVLRVLSIGTLDQVRRFQPRLATGGRLRWGVALFNEMMDGQSSCALGQAKLLVGKENLVRVSPPVAAGQYAMDDASTVDDLLAESAHHADHHARDIERIFLSRRAPRFTPNHGAPADGRPSLRRAA